MAESAQLNNLKPRHIALAQYIIANPHARLPELCRYMNMTPSWVSIIMNSDVFKDYLAQVDETLLENYLIPLRTKMAGVAHRAVEKLGEAVENSQDPAFILAAADKTLHRLGYAPSKGPSGVAPVVTNQQNNYYVSKDALAAARASMGNEPRQTQNQLQQEVQNDTLPAPTEVSPRG